MRVAAGIVPRAVPAILGEDRAKAAASRWPGSPPESHPVWKTLLRDGDVATAFAAQVGDTLGRIHAATADRADVAARFRHRRHLLRHPARALPGRDRRARTPTSRRGSPHWSRPRAAPAGCWSTATSARRTSCAGPDGPVILDAECAWYGDPAFDLAFVLNHLLLKGVWRPAWRDRYLDALRRAGRRLSRARRLGAAGGDGSAHRGAAAGTAARPRRRQVAGRVPDRRARSAPRCAPSPARCCCSRSPISPSIGRRWREARDAMKTTHRRASAPAGSGIRAAGRPSRRR